MSVCPFCSEEIAANSVECPSCGMELRRAFPANVGDALPVQSSKSNAKKWILIGGAGCGFCLLILACLAAFLLPMVSKARDAARELAAEAAVRNEQQPQDSDEQLMEMESVGTEDVSGSDGSPMSQATTVSPGKKLTTEEAAEVMAWEIGEWEIRGQGAPTEGQPQAIKMPKEARWKIEGKSIEYKFTVQEGGKTVNYFGHQEYDADRGIFVYRSKWGNNPETTSHSRHNLATGTSRAQTVPATPTAGQTTTTVTKRIGADKTQQRLEVRENGRLVYSHDVVSTRKSD